MAKQFEYKIEKNVPIVRPSHFDKDQPEYIIMMKMKPGESFEFPAARVRNVSNTRLHIIKDNPQMVFTHTGEPSMRLKNLKTGRCWRLEDGSSLAAKNALKKKPK